MDDNLLHLTFIGFILATELVPKIPFAHVNYTYIKIRYDDFFPVILVGVFAVQWLRKKIVLNTKFLGLVLIFWAAVFISFLVGYYLQNTVIIFNTGLLNTLRRFQYMAVFFVASSVVVSEARFTQYMKYYIWALLFVAVYGVGQKFLSFPSIQSMNPAYVDGRILFLTPQDRINSTFGGHFDLAAYLTFSIPILFGYYFSKGKKIYFVFFIAALIALLYTSARSSFIAYIISISALFVYFRKFRLYFLVFLLTAVLLFVTGDMTKRFLQTFQIKTVFVNTKTGGSQISQKISTKNLPAGNLKIPLLKTTAANVNESEIQNVALAEAIKEEQRSGRKLNIQQIQKRADEIAKYIKPERTVLCDIACATRLQIEWPRAIGAFLFDPLFGSGPSSITEASDNDFLRWLGETGLIGTLAFLAVLYSIFRYIWNAAKKMPPEKKYIYYSFGFGLLALLVNALYVDVFEASKVAYNFWLVAGLFVGVIKLSKVKKHEKRIGK